MSAGPGLGELDDAAEAKLSSHLGLLAAMAESAATLPPEMVGETLQHIANSLRLCRAMAELQERSVQLVEEAVDEAILRATTKGSIQ